MGSQGEGRTRNPAVNSRVLCQLSYLGSVPHRRGYATTGALDPGQLPTYLRSKVLVGDCWIWTGARGSKGYGSVGVPNQHRTELAHRHIYELLVGPIPDGLTLDHFVCFEKTCVNPAHLEPVTFAENTRRANAMRPRKTRCKYGHPTLASTDRTADGMCKACKNERARAKSWWKQLEVAA